MKKFLFFLAFVPFIMGYAQDEVNLLTAKNNELKREYLRPSLSQIYVGDGTDFAMSILTAMQEIQTSKFDVNPISEPIFTLSLSADKKSDVATVKTQIDDIVEKRNFGREIMHTWFPSFSKKEGFTLDVLVDRGNFAATDNDVLRAKSSYRSSVLTELGEKLIDHSYLLAHYVYTSVDRNGNISAKIMTFAYKLNFDDAVRTTFYEKYFLDENGIDKGEFPMIYLTAATKGNYLTDVSVVKSNDTPIEENASDLYNFSMLTLASRIADFQVKTPVMYVSPIRAKVGTKEGLYIDDRFYVMEMQLDKNGEKVAKRKGVVRVSSHIADNNYVATGETQDYTQFYQIQGGKIMEGMTLVEKPDFGISFTPIISSNNLGAMVEYRGSTMLAKLLKNSKFKGIPGMYVYIKGDLPFGMVESKFKLASIENYMFPRVSYGIGKEFNFLRMFNANALVGYGSVGVIKSGDASNVDLQCSFINVGARFGVQLLPMIQIFAHAEYDIYLGRDASFLTSNFGVSPFGVGIGSKISF